MPALYLDSSAIVKLVTPEVESPALLEFLHAFEERISSVLARVEVHRTLHRAHGTPAERRRAERVLRRIALVQIDGPIIAVASQLAPADLRSLDAIHLATALSVSGALAGMVTYDERLARAATVARVRVYAPE
ncbi:MAG: type II toxin-antitoxin system VapC family toxin [Deltaproteobacteria bacterium]|nr:type II toxin-antitoxin system VapC family toxin [Deltaproteobacteria bacterium]